MSYNILAQDLIEQSPHLYMHCHPDIMDWSYRFTNLLQEIQHWDPEVSVTFALGTILVREEREILSILLLASV